MVSVSDKHKLLTADSSHNSLYSQPFAFNSKNTSQENLFSNQNNPNSSQQETLMEDNRPLRKDSDPKRKLSTLLSDYQTDLLEHSDQTESDE